MLPDETEDAIVSVRRRQRLFSGLLLLVIAAMAAAIWFAYAMLRQHQDSLAKLPGMVAGIQALDGEVAAHDSKIADTVSDHRELSARVDILGNNLRASIDSARRAALDATAAWMHRVEEQLGGQIGAVKTQ